MMQPPYFAFVLVVDDLISSQILGNDLRLIAILIFGSSAIYRKSQKEKEG
jgi:hypothetical protein